MELRQLTYFTSLYRSAVSFAYALASLGISRRTICLRDPDRSTCKAEAVFVDLLTEKLNALQRATSAYTNVQTKDDE